LAHPLALACLVLGLPAAGVGGPSSRPPEALLAHDSVAYFRFDGLEPHRKAYEQTVLAEVMRGDLGDFCAELVRLLEEAVGFDIVKERVLAGVPPEGVVKIHEAARQLPRLREYLRHHGFVLAVEVPEILPPQLQVTVVFPQGGQPPHRAAVFGGLQLVTELNQLAVRQAKQGGRVIYRASPPRVGKSDKKGKEANEGGGLAFAWWQEGEHIVLTFGTEEPDHLLRRLDDPRRPNLTGNPLFRSVAGFKRYESLARGFVDLEACVRKAQGLGSAAKKFIDELGLAGLRSLTLHIGFCGRHQQTTLALHVTGKRTGVLKLIPAAEVSLDRLPLLPPDALTVTAFSIDAPAWAEFAGAMLLGGGTKALDEIDRALGIDFRKDLVQALGRQAVLYTSPGEGLSVLGAGLAVEVKDVPKVRTALDTMMQSLAADAGVLKKNRYRGVEVRMFRRPMDFTPTSPCWTVHEGWCVGGFNPASAKGHILRATGRFKSWKPPPLAREFLSDIKRNPRAKVLAVCVADVRASLKQTLMFGQILSAVIGTYRGNSFDPSMVPHFQALTEPVTPNVLVLVDDGEAIRLEMKGSLPLPTDIVGTDSILLLGLFGGLGLDF
jgi:hypothetical protein